MAGICDEDVSFPLYAPNAKIGQERDTRFQATAASATIENCDEPRHRTPSVRA
jgi:hypothetical protein